MNLFVGVVDVRLLVLVWMMRSCGELFKLLWIMVFVFVIVGYLKYLMFLFDGNIFVLRYFLFELYRNMVCVRLIELVLVGDKDLLFIDKLFRLFCLVWGLGFWSIEKWFFKGRVIISFFLCFFLLVFVEDWYFGLGFILGVLGNDIGIFEGFCWRFIICFLSDMIFFLSLVCLWSKFLVVFVSFVFFLCKEWLFFWSFLSSKECWCSLLFVDFICVDRL